MKFSLRSLMIAVTLVCVVLGGRVEYLRRMAAWHEQEARRFDLKMVEAWVRQAEEREKKSDGTDSQMMAFGSNGGDDTQASRYHEAMAIQFRKGLLHSWSPVFAPEGIDLPHSDPASEEVRDSR